MRRQAAAQKVAGGASALTWFYAHSRGPTQSPARIAGLRRIATLVALRFVASPQRVPGIGHRHRGRSVVNVIDRLPPRLGFLQHRRYLAATSLGEHPVAGTVPAKTDTHDCCPIREHRSINRIAYHFRLRRGGKIFKKRVLACR